MHSSSFDSEGIRRDGGEVLVAVAALVTEGRTPGKSGSSASASSSSSARGYFEGPHCSLNRKTAQEHNCDPSDKLCSKYRKVRNHVLGLWEKGIPLCVEVLLTAACACSFEDSTITTAESSTDDNDLLLEQWYFNTLHRRSNDAAPFTLPQLINAIRSQLHFSQLSSWLSTKDEAGNPKISTSNLRYRLTVPEENLETSNFTRAAVRHDFPITDIGNGYFVNISYLSLPRMSSVPPLKCSNCKPKAGNAAGKFGPDFYTPPAEKCSAILDDRMQTFCKLKGKHRCEDYEEFESNLSRREKPGRKPHYRDFPQPSTSSSSSSSSTSLSSSGSGGGGAQKPHLTLNIAKVQAYYNCQKKVAVAAAERRREDAKNAPQTAEVKQKWQGGQKNCPIINDNNNDLGGSGHVSKGQMLLDAIIRSGQKQSCGGTKNNNKIDGGRSVSGGSGGDKITGETKKSRDGDGGDRCDEKCVQKMLSGSERDEETGECASASGRFNEDDDVVCTCDKSNERDIYSIKNISSKKIRYNNNNNINNLLIDDDDCDNNKSAAGAPRKIYSCEREKTVAKKFNISSATAAAAAVLSSRARKRITFDDHNDDKNKNLPPVKTAIATAATNSAVTDDEKSSKQKTKNNGNLAIEVPTPSEQAKFRKNLDSAASMVFHSRTGLPLTSSPAPVRRGKSCFDFDSSINSVSAIKSALFSVSCSTDEESESDGSIVSPCSPDSSYGSLPRQENDQNQGAKRQKRGQHAATSLLGSFEESVLNGRLEPVSTVHGFRAELGASGSFVPRHLVVPVTVFFYTLGDNDKVSSPYLGHINLGRKGYNVPKSGTVQVTLFNPLGTVVKMFVIMYNLSDMPPNSQTFIRQRTLYMPTNCRDENLEWGPKWLRYLIHLRFMSSKSGRIYLHSDIRMIIFRKSDLDTATAHGIDMSYELRSFTHMPTNPKFSPRK